MIKKIFLSCFFVCLFSFSVPSFDKFDPSKYGQSKARNEEICDRLMRVEENLKLAKALPYNLDLLLVCMEYDLQVCSEILELE